jgi:hypothetical protein
MKPKHSLHNVLSRRSALKGLAAGAAITATPWRKLAAAAEGEEPHFFLHLTFSHAIDASYFFDARPALFTEKGKKANYLIKNDDASKAITDPNLQRLETLTSIEGTGHGGKALRTALVDPLMPFFKDSFSVLNGVFMSFDPGHPGNYRTLYGGAPSSRTSFLPHIGNQLKSPLASVHISGCNPFNEDNEAPANFEGSLVLRYDGGAKIGKDLKTNLRPDPAGAALQQMRATYRRFADPTQLFGRGNQRMADAIESALPLYDSFLGLGDDVSDLTFECRSFGETGLPDIGKVLPTVESFFRAGVTNALTLNFDDLDNFDMHSSFQAQNLFATYTRVTSQLEQLLTFLNSEYKDGLRWIDVTTFMVTSEFTRTMVSDFFRSDPDASVGNTGTDHNPLSNTVLIGGKGIRTGLVIGASDLDQLGDDGDFAGVTGAHKDAEGRLSFFGNDEKPAYNKAMAKPFDHDTLMPVEGAAPEKFNQPDYLTINNVTNTVLAAFGVTENNKLAPEEPSSGKTAKVLSALLKGRGV